MQYHNSMRFEDMTWLFKFGYCFAVQSWILSTIIANANGALVISPSENQFKTANSGVIFTCSIPDFEYDGTFPNIRWKNPHSEWIDDTKGRVYIEKDDIRSVRLYITRIAEGDAGLYTCEDDSTGSDEYADVKLFIYEDIRFTDTEKLVRAAVGTGASPLLPCLATGQPPPVISWRFQRKRLPNGSLVIPKDGDKYRYETGGLRIFNLEPSDNGTYECRAEVSDHGKFQIRPIELDVLYPPLILGGPTSLTAVAGETVDLKCDATGNPNITYEWFREQKMSDMIKVKVRLPGNKATYTIKKMLKEDVGRYFCKVQNRLGIAESFADIDIIIPPAIQDLPQKVALEGRTVIILCDVTGDPDPTITWMKDGEEDEYVMGPQPNDNNIAISTVKVGLSKLTIYGIKRSYAGTYICIARNSAGESRKSAKLVVDYVPQSSISTTDLLGWPGQIRNVTCTSSGLPLPTVNWFRGTQYINSGHDVFQVDTIESKHLVVSTLTINIGKQPWIYDKYKCIAKNLYGYDTIYVNLNKAETPGMPQQLRNEKPPVTTDNEVDGHVNLLLSANFPKKNGSKPLTGWKIEYESKDHEHSGEEFYELGQPLLVSSLRADTEYLLSVSIGNEIGYGPAAKFTVRTHLGPGRKNTSKNVQSDLPSNIPDEKVIEDETEKEEKNKNYAPENQPGAKGEVKVQAPEDTASAISTAMVAGITVAAVLALTLTSIALCICKKKRRHHLMYLGRKQVDYGTNMYVSGRMGDEDNIQLDMRKREPLPDILHPDNIKSPMMEGRKNTPKSRNRSVDSNLVNLAAKTPTIQKQAWEMMKQRQDEVISDEEDEEFLQGEEADNLPLPPPFLLDNIEGGMISQRPRDDDCESYQDIIEGYHSGDNVDDIEEADFEVRVPSGYDQNTYISYDPVT